MRWIACVPNVSEGRRPEVIDAIAAAAAAPGARLLDRSSDPDHNRTVLTIAGPPSAVVEAAFRCAAEAVKRIDLAAHEGVHPRLGAADVLPLVPLLGTTLEECAALARALAARLEAELGVPTRLFDAACPKGTTLPELRKEAPQGHPTAGVTCVGARGALIAFNVNLESEDLALAQRVAAEVRKLPQVRALGFPLESRGCVQVSMNLLDWRQTPPARALDEVRRHARVKESEIVGMIPREALDQGFALSLGCRPPAVLDLPPSFFDRLAAPDAAPGGGAAAAHTGAMAAALVAMCAGITGEELLATRARAEELRADLERLTEEDGEAYARYLLLKTDEALQQATLVPLLIAEKSAEVLLLAQGAASRVLRAAAPDLKGAMRFAGAASEHAAATARFNLQEIANQDFVKDVRLRLLRIP
jgi:glutamate formiminotransferase/formiminotetrahydrofolate cyclodeaminase